MKRRQFLQRTAAAAASLLTIPVLSSCTGGIKKQLGLQLYTLRDTIAADPKAVLEKVAAFGYKEIETFAHENGMIYGMPIADFGKYVKDLGMKVVSGHYGLNLTQGETWEKHIAEALDIGQEYMVVPYLDEPARKTLDDYKRICSQLNQAGTLCKQNGIRFGYHNHDFEFQAIEGQKPFDLMLAELQPEYVGIEMDVYWVVRAGEDPVRYFNEHPGRFEQWHVKDMDKSDKDRNTDLGTGTIDYRSLFDHADKSGLKHWYVEQESYPGEPIDSVAANARFLKEEL